MKPLYKIASLALMVGFLSACAGTADKANPAKTGATPAKDSVEAIFKEAREEIDASGWGRAIELYEKVQSLDALGVYGRQALVDTAFAQWRNGDPAIALTTLDRYLRLFPKSDGTAYALYLKGLINFNERSGLFAKFSGEDLSQRDPKQLREGYDVFQRIVKEYPDSKYAPEAAQRLTYIVNTLAQHEVGIALYYLQRNAPLAAINRAQDTLKQFSETPAQEEALGIMIEGYRQLGMLDLKADTEKVLSKNYPKSRHLSGATYTRPPKSFFALW
jgi:outer membrane protein assembly factor BamD